MTERNAEVYFYALNNTAKDILKIEGWTEPSDRRKGRFSRLKEHDVLLRLGMKVFIQAAGATRAEHLMLKEMGVKEAPLNLRERYILTLEDRRVLRDQNGQPGGSLAKWQKETFEERLEIRKAELNLDAEK